MARRLQLSRETLRTLSGEALSLVAGGQLTDTSVVTSLTQCLDTNCATQSTTTNPVSKKCNTGHPDSAQVG